MLKIENLVKTYGRFTAVDHLSLELEKGDIYGFVGPNGAGKTTTIVEMLKNKSCLHRMHPRAKSTVT